MKIFFVVVLNFYCLCTYSNVVDTFHIDSSFFYKDYKASVGYGTGGKALLKIYKGKKLIIIDHFFDGMYKEVKFADINNDSIIDFIVEWGFEDGPSVSAFISKNNKYIDISILDGLIDGMEYLFDLKQVNSPLYLKDTCDETEAHFFTPEYKDFVILDMDGDSKLDIVTNVFVDKDGKMKFFCYSQIVTNKEIIKSFLSKKRRLPEYIMYNDFIKRK